MRALATLVFLGLASAAYADELLWARIKTESNIVVLTRNMHSAGGKMPVWDESGGCKGEARLTSEGRADSRKLGVLTLELVDEAELVVGKVSDSGEVEVLGKMRLR
jgi:hypothetical protein